MSEAIRRWQPPEGTLLQATQVGWFVSHSDHLAAVAKLEAERDSLLPDDFPDLRSYISHLVYENTRWTNLNYALIQDKKTLEAEHDDFERKGKELCSAYGNALIKIHDMEKRLERMQARFDFLREGFRVIVYGSHEAAKADNYVRYAQDCLSGPTEETLQTLIAARATAPPAKP